MKRNKLSTIILYLVINLAMIAIIFGLFFIFSKRFEIDYQKNYVKQFQILLSDKVNEKLEIDLENFKNLVDNKTVNELNNDILRENLSGQTPYIEFINVSGNQVNYQGFTYYLDRNPLSDYHLFFFTQTNHFGFIDNDVIGIFAASEYFESVFSLTNSKNGFIMDYKGEIFYHSNSEFNYLVLENYFEFDTTILFAEGDFSKQLPEITISTTFKNEDSLFMFTKLANFNDLYVAQHFIVSDIETYLSPYTIFLLVLLLLYVGLGLLILLFIFYYVDKKTNDIEAKRMLYYYNKPYIISIDNKFNIKKINETLKTEIGNDYYHLSDLVEEYSEELANSRLERGQSLPILINGVEYPFVPLKVRGGYYLVAKTDFDQVIDPKLERLAYISPITNLPNYYKLLNDLETYYNNLVVNKEKNFSVLMLDIKGFRHINKNLKRESGDYVLKIVGERIKQLLLGKELFLYSQEDLYIILMPNKTKKNAEDLMKQINQDFLKPVQVLKNNMTLNLVGAIIEVHNETNMLAPKEVLNHLDETLKRAKELTTSNYYIFDETISHYVTFRRQTEVDLLEALKKNEIEVYLQPKYNYQTDRIVGFESLVRWNHPQYFQVSPLEYITLAEENGLIVELGNIIKTKTFEAAKVLEKHNMQISLNISPIEIMQPGFIDDFLNEYKKYKFRDNTIIVELTETAIIESIMVVNEKLKILQKNGILVHLDDFGTGYSTLPYIKDLRFDAIKIDKMYIDYIDTDSYSKAIVNMIISLAKTLNLTVIAEGVEHERQMKELVKLGCYIIQGYLISPAINLDDAIKLIIDYNVEDTKGFKGGKKQ